MNHELQRRYGLHTVGKNKVIGDNSQCTSVRVQTVYLVPQPWFGSEVLIVAVEGVSEVDVLVTWVDGDVVEGVELPPKVVVHEDWRDDKLSGFEMVCRPERGTYLSCYMAQEGSSGIGPR